MEIDSEIIAYCILGLFIWVITPFAVIKWAVSDALEKKLKNQNFNLIMLNRLLIKQLLKQGYTKKELLELHNQDSNQFWDNI